MINGRARERRHIQKRPISTRQEKYRMSARPLYKRSHICAVFTASASHLSALFPQRVSCVLVFVSFFSRVIFIFYFLTRRRCVRCETAGFKKKNKIKRRRLLNSVVREKEREIPITIKTRETGGNGPWLWLGTYRASALFVAGLRVKSIFLVYFFMFYFFFSPEKTKTRLEANCSATM